jgi:hypothetical protein
MIKIQTQRKGAYKTGDKSFSSKHYTSGIERI